MKKPLSTLNLRFEQDVVQARQRAREIADLLGFDHSEQIRLATATSEIARNAFRYARGGRVEFRVEANTPPPRLFIKVTDSGSGIKKLDEILEGRYQSSTGLGKGILGTQRLMDSFEIDTGADGTTIEMSKIVPKYAPEITPQRLEAIGRKISQRKPENPYEEVERQNQELLKTLAELRSRQEELSQLNDELEDTNRGVVALYAELDDRADTLRRMSDAKTSFLSGMSHEFRTPLNSILSLSQMLLQKLDGDLSTEQEKQISYIRAAAYGLHEMVNDLLDIAKVEAGKVEVKAREFEVEDLFGALRGMLRPLLQTASVNLVFEEPEALPTMFSDEGKLSQILRNFISNALKFTERGEVRVTAKLFDDKTVVFEVADTGIGIAPQDQERVFQEFVQVDSPLQKSVKGTGLGLPLTRNLAKLLGGKVTLQSELGMGSTFSVYVPVVLPGSENEEHSQLPELDPNRQPIVLIEDNRETAFVMEKILERSEFQLIPAYNVETGMDFVQRTGPTAVILDLMIDGESSWETLKQLRERKIPVLMVSVMRSEQAKAIAFGADAFLAKPVSRDALVHSLRAVTHRGEVRKVLLIDDDELARYSLCELLSAKVDIIEARSGREGLLRAEEDPPDVVFLDLHMPDMSGFEVLHQLRLSDFGRDIPVVIHSSQEMSEDEKLRLRLPYVTILSKRDTSGADAMERINHALLTIGFTMEPKRGHHA